MTAPDTPAEFGPLAFFRDLRAAFSATLRDGPRTDHAVLQQAWDTFDGNVAIQSRGEPSIACRKGCPGCCSLRVVALSPEVFMVQQFVRATAPAWLRHGIDLEQRIREADALTRGLDETQRVATRRSCPFVEQGVCLIHRVRPLACRGHASYDRRACADAAAGRVQDVPFSGPHRLVRSLVQSALQAALRSRGLAWGAVEFNHALVVALDDASSRSRWNEGLDPLAAAAVDSELHDEMAATFDQI